MNMKSKKAFKTYFFNHLINKRIKLKRISKCRIIEQVLYRKIKRRMLGCISILNAKIRT